ncbi:hypothetical protein GIB67_022020 [Kingdonia uniflora]|uniref:Aminotransferase-like plant mobile domain-containing protein n=1 Tax=Kingdonia uniflora TaxID=39325 RepID=A0A7J7P2M9_9MAGN|nr:hypothetical protein GIB67_022020 [Kingdonia uniflora]
MFQPGLLQRSEMSKLIYIILARNSRCSMATDGVFYSRRDILRSWPIWTPPWPKWPYAILASLYHVLDTAFTAGGAITRFPQLLEYWFYEYCGVGHPIVKEALKITSYSCLKAWEKGNKKKINDHAANFFTLGRYLISHQTIESINWQPWGTFVALDLDDVRTVSFLSRKRMLLQVPNENGEYYLGDRCWRQLTGTVGILLDPLLNMSPHLSLADLQRMGNADLFGPSVLRAGITPVVVISVDVHSLSQDFSLPGEEEGPDLGWYMEWTWRREMLPIHRLRDPPPMSAFYDAEEL